MRLHPEVPLLAFGRLLHLGKLVVLILRRARRVDDRRVDDGAVRNFGIIAIRKKSAELLHAYRVDEEIGIVSTPSRWARARFVPSSSTPKSESWYSPGTTTCAPLQPVESQNASDRLESTTGFFRQVVARHRNCLISEAHHRTVRAPDFSVTAGDGWTTDELRN